MARSTVLKPSAPTDLLMNELDSNAHRHRVTSEFISISSQSKKKKG